MPPVPAASPATGAPVPAHYVHTASGHFLDAHGRTLLLRGVNLSGAAKAPLGAPSHRAEHFWDDAAAGRATFVGRPLNLDDGSADLHLARLRGWGFNMLRYVVTWEALEHDGPGKYDYEFMDYTVRVLLKCKEYGFRVFIDPHQDIWSRFSGGSGAPYWTLIACGINPRHFTATQAAIVHCEYPLADDPHPETLPAMLWSTNYGRLAAQTLFTLFFGGRDFAPKCIIDGINIQDYLEEHYLAAFTLLAQRIRDAPGDLLDACVLGWDSMNEPFEGFCGNPDLASAETTHGASLKKGTHPTVLQSLRLGMGRRQTVEHWKFGAFGPQRDGSVTIDPKGRKMWLDPDEEPGGIHPRWGWTRDPQWRLGTCVWALHGVWDVASGEFLDPTYFATIPSTEPGQPGRPAVFIEDYWKPHWRRYAARIRAMHPEAIHFVQPPVFVTPPPLDDEDAGSDSLLRGRCCYSGHFYDGLTLVTRHWNWFNADALGLLRGKYRYKLQAVKIGTSAIRASLRQQLAMLKEDAAVLGPYPTLIGEIGTPFDMDDKRAYDEEGEYLGDYSSQQKALDASLNGADGGNCVNYTIWTYCPDNSHEWGDGWNGEDLSLWSPDDMWRHRRQPQTQLQRWRMGYERDTGATMSAAELLKGESEEEEGSETAVAVVARPVASSSTLSLATLGQPNDGLFIGGGGGGKGKDVDGPGIAAHLWDYYGNSPLDFLMDGARAVHAFSRPYPVATVGVPVDMQFDIASTRFELRVRVGPEDRPVAAAALRPEGGEDREGGEPKEEGEEGGGSPVLPTEIFIPLVHYASQSLVARSAGAAAGGYDDSEGEEEQEQEQEQELRERGREQRGGGMATPQPQLQPGLAAQYYGSSTTSVATVVPPAAASADDAAAAAAVREPEFDLDVQVSEGRWEVVALDGDGGGGGGGGGRGLVRWWYDVPARGESAVERTIVIERVGGAIVRREGAMQQQQRRRTGGTSVQPMSTPRGLCEEVWRACRCRW